MQQNACDRILLLFRTHIRCVQTNEPLRHKIHRYDMIVIISAISSGEPWDSPISFSEMKRKHEKNVCISAWRAGEVEKKKCVGHIAMIIIIIIVYWTSEALDVALWILYFASLTHISSFGMCVCHVHALRPLCRIYVWCQSLAFDSEKNENWTEQKYKKEIKKHRNRNKSNVEGCRWCVAERLRWWALCSCQVPRHTDHIRSSISMAVNFPFIPLPSPSPPSMPNITNDNNKLMINTKQH